MGKFTTSLLVFVVLLLLPSCTPTEPINVARVTATGTAVPIPTTTLMPSSTATQHLMETPTLTPSATLTPSITPTPTASRTPRPSITPTATPTLEPVEPLTIRYPSATQLEEYLLAIPTGYFHTTSSFEDDRDSIVRSFYYRGLTIAAEIIYADVNGDGIEDLVISDELLAAVFLWTGNEYATPFIIVGPSWEISSSSQTSVADWTHDDIPEIIFDYLSDFWNPGVRYDNWTRFIISCQGVECHIAWRGLLTSLTDDYNLGGITLIRATLQTQTDDQQRVWLEYIRRSFSIYNYNPDPQWWETWLAEEPFDTLKVFTSTVSSFAWNGSTFELEEEKPITNAYIVNENAILEAEADSMIASITAESNHAADGLNDVCQLFVQDHAVGSVFGCKRNFTTVAWSDIVGDQQPEIVVQALSAKEPHDLNFDLITDISCMHQRLIIYEWDGENATEVANVAGCVVQSDLYGVRLVDYDSDGQLEIMAASSWFTEPVCYPEPSFSCWFEFGYTNQIFKWDGSKFELWAEVPEETE
ncbi:MAG: hypothetical protein H6662_20140 [Ardenticatenaceae bacterium]|nr:hypothetical protein [Ardenticatenaceae bacterium]MCB8990459.1 hypothetical protein [Ardenticatenaceae bacterium]MCB9003473.1 hypothetical protein [Ardenticatenaceae bacterium]